MNIETQIKVRNNPYLYRYLRDNSAWYKVLNRHPEALKDMEEESFWENSEKRRESWIY